MEQINITAEDMLKRYDKVEKSPNGKAGCYHCEEYIPIDSSICPTCGVEVTLCKACGWLVPRKYPVYDGCFDCPACYSKVKENK